MDQIPPSFINALRFSSPHKLSFAGGLATCVVSLAVVRGAPLRSQNFWRQIRFPQLRTWSTLGGPEIRVHQTGLVMTRHVHPISKSREMPVENSV
ncbi:hypothetical protein OE88DRAFT_1656993 [Heliocybe sulcata]|uniref:Uncharacterized protein n=1 Tax=Heliocybe sulcata TaxID=5364 RepID=A0A5C3N9K8_9AGAM|nr:hypothetical protein OE88DRAFT_1656993 [Heliocybe sulcata]